MRNALMFILIAFVLQPSAFSAIHCDNADDFIDMNYGPSIGANEDFSYAFWMNHDNTGTAEENPFGANVSGGPGDMIQLTFYSGCASHANPAAVVRGDPVPGSDIFCSDTAVTNGQWEHIAFTYDEDGNATLYLNGNVVAQAAPVNSDNIAKDLSSNEFTLCARRLAGTPDTFFDGAIEEFYFWKGVALSQNEVEKLSDSRVRRSGCQVQPSSLARYFPLDDVADGSSGDGVSFRDPCTQATAAVGDDGANNTGLDGEASNNLTYP